MASYTDDPRALGTFNPYVQQLPVEAMVEVGMKKQQMYNEGLQKIQTNIDNIAGLDVIRGVDKKYLQSKLNEMGNNLRTVAAGDFSDFQLVNSTSGMVNQIAKDRNIQSAVSSSSRYRNELARIEKDRAEGKENPNNTKYFHKRSNAWLNGQVPGESLNESYFAPVDVWGKLKDIAKEVGIDEKDIQQLYETDNAGNIRKDASGKPVFSQVMTEKILKGKDPAKILNAFQSALGASEYKQLAIDGEGNLEHLSPVQLKERVVNNTSAQINKTEIDLTDLKVALMQENSKNKKNPERISSLQNQIAYFDKHLDTLTKSRDNDLQMVDIAPDAVRASLWTNNYLQTMSNTLSSQETAIKYTANPGWQANMELNKFNFDIQRAKIQDQHWSIEQSQKFKEFEYKKQHDQEELYLKYGVGKPVGGTSVDLGIPTADISNQREAVETDYSNTVGELNKTNYDLTLAYFKGINSKKPGETEDVYNKRMQTAIKEYSTKTKEPINLGASDINTFTARFGAKQQKLWSENPQSVPLTYRDIHAKQEQLTTQALNQKGFLETVRKNAIKEAVNSGIDVKEYGDITKKIKPVSITMPNKSKVTLTAQDVLDFASIHPEVSNFFGKLSVDADQSKRKKEAIGRQQKKWGNQFGTIEKTLYDVKKYEGDSALGSMASKVLNKFIGEGDTYDSGTVITPKSGSLQQAIRLLNNSNHRKVREIENRMFQEKANIAQPKAFPVMRGKENVDDVNARVSSVIDKYVAQGKINETEDFSAEDLQSALLGGTRAVETIVIPGLSSSTPDTYKLRVTGKKGKTSEVTIDAGDFQAIHGYAPPTKQNIPETYKSLQYYNTTNKGGEGSSNPATAGYPASKFTNLKDADYTLKGDLIPVQGVPGKYIFTMYKYDKNTGNYLGTIEVPEPVYSEVGGVINQDLDYLPSSISKSVIDQLERKNR